MSWLRLKRSESRVAMTVSLDGLDRLDSPAVPRRLARFRLVCSTAKAPSSLNDENEERVGRV